MKKNHALLLLGLTIMPLILEGRGFEVPEDDGKPIHAVHQIQNLFITGVSDTNFVPSFRINDDFIKTYFDS